MPPVLLNLLIQVPNDIYFVWTQTMTIPNVCFMGESIRNVQCNEHYIQPPPTLGLIQAAKTEEKYQKYINMPNAFFIETLIITPQH